MLNGMQCDAMEMGNPLVAVERPSDPLSIRRRMINHVGISTTARKQGRLLYAAGLSDDGYFCLGPSGHFKVDGITIWKKR